MGNFDQDRWLAKYGDLGSGRVAGLSIHGWTVADLRAIIEREREAGRAFGVAAESARHELARRGLRA